MKKNLFALFIALLSVGQVFALPSHSTHYGKIVATTMGNGTVYLSTSKDSKTGGTESAVTVGTSVEQSWNCGGAEGSDSKTFYAFATASEGYHFAGWSQSATSNDNTSSDNPYEATHSASGSEGSPSSLSIYAYFEANPAVSVTFVYPDAVMGTLKYTNDGTTKTITEQTVVETNNAFDLTATPQQNYKFLRWWKSTDNGVTKVDLGFDAQLTNISFLENCMVGIEFIPATTPVFIVKGGDGTMYTDLNAACAAAKNVSGKTVVLFSDGTLPAGSYTISQGVTLLIPFDDEYSCYTTEPMILHGWRTEDDKGQRSSVTDPSTDQSFVYSTLTLASGAQLNIEGIVSLSAKRWCVINSGVSGSGSSATYSNANPSGSNRIYQGFGLINMENNSSIQVKSGGKLYCWGRIRGEGAIIAKSGAEVRESYVYTDWRNNDYFATYAKKTRCFPQNQYYIQDIQVPITYESGATCNLVAALFYSKGTSAQKGTMNFVGTSNSFIELPTGATMTKKYDATTDRLIIDLENGASFNNFKLKITAPSFEAATSSHIFTITNNWTVNINSGTTNMTYDLAWAPGSVLNIKQGAAVTMLNGMSMYVYDHDDWGDFAAGRRIQPLKKPSQEASYGVTVKTRTYDADCPDAEFIVDGTLTVTGGQNIVMNSTATGCSFDNSNKGTFQSGLYTTEAGANIHGIGTIQYLKGCGDQTKTQQLNLTTDWNTNVAASNIKYSSFPIDVYGTGMARPTITPAQLKNADDSYTATTGASGMSTFKYFSEDGEWKQAWKVTFMNEGEEFSSAYYAQGDEIIPPTEQPQKEGYRFKGWGDVAATMGTEDLEYEAQWEQIVVVTTIEITQTKVITDNSEAPITESTYVINKQVQAEVVKVDEGAAIEITENASVETQTLALSTTPSAIDIEQGKAGSSSQIKGKGAINAQNVFIDITMDPSGTLDASKYYAFAVPFAVKVDGGVQQFKNNEWVDCIHDTHYRAYTYDGANRAINGKGSNWTLVNTPTFHPGTFYLVEFAPGMGNVYRFTKAGESDLNNAADINLEAFASAKTADKGWNGIANNALQNVTISLSNTGVAQVFDPAKNEFVTVSLVNTQFAIGTPLFVQTDGAGTATNSAVAQPASIPARMLAQPQTETLGNYTVRIAAENADKMADQLFISASEDAENNYVIGKDLVKMFMGNATTAQLWVNNYDKKLSMHQALLANGSAEASLTLYAPKAGNYKVYLTDIPEDATLYLLENGEVIANLNDGAYNAALTKGENARYGLRICAAKTMPDVVTSISETIAIQGVKKILLQGNVYIVRDGKLFNMLGQFVK